uniref:Protein kinase domain-containing protein n=1 Tax=Pyramimonas obovata TaxID=1411642 RepID=A0A7S0N6E0_9CHLO|mmetsp:Transcript_20173/g.44177  ORF Transcript_20173/g.44177 Transcript_20173/m.44177 type:complete len:1108 (+) Transcript_20173:229-3552(+)|eukprot:CAMPEP_0118937754 /NCGR_PEP_ID=MMETSP1169-20130426/23710_1 /TAXON_ID=36882 /ORGANISM="Pyramimonas obovata, Strain CCMP722" /LENGTH=1107 /DNA_ID=CAMNT_0006881487 /DNA_START=164 /DNA_END=3487 /DNA_ORIENTATION=+
MPSVDRADSAGGSRRLLPTPTSNRRSLCPLAGWVIFFATVLPSEGGQHVRSGLRAECYIDSSALGVAPPEDCGAGMWTDVWNEQQYRAALRTATITNIFLRDSINMTQAVWPASDPIIIQSRTVEVSSSYDCELPHRLALEGVGAGSIIVHQDAKIEHVRLIIVQPFSFSSRTLHAYKQSGSGRVTFQQCHFLSACEHLCARPHANVPTDNCDDVADPGMLNSLFLDMEAYECTIECSSRQAIHIMPLEPGEVSTLMQDVFKFGAMGDAEPHLDEVVFYTLLIFTLVTMVAASAAISFAYIDGPRWETPDCIYEDNNKLWGQVEQKDFQTTPSLESSHRSSWHPAASNNYSCVDGLMPENEGIQIGVPQAQDKLENISVLVKLSDSDTLVGEGSLELPTQSTHWNIGQVVMDYMLYVEYLQRTAKLEDSCYKVESHKQPEDDKVLDLSRRRSNDPFLKTSTSSIRESGSNGSRAASEGSRKSLSTSWSYLRNELSQVLKRPTQTSHRESGGQLGGQGQQSHPNPLGLLQDDGGFSDLKSVTGLQRWNPSDKAKLVGPLSEEDFLNLQIVRCFLQKGRVGKGKEVYLAHMKGETQPLVFSMNKSFLQTLTPAHMTKMTMLQHPHVMPYLSLFSRHDVLFMLTPYEPANTLAHLLEVCKTQKQKLSEEIILEWFMQLSMGLHFLHQHGIVHGDLCPSNIYISSNGHLKMGYYGVSDNSALQEGAQHESMAPEVADSTRPSKAADVWALGAIVQQMCELRHCCAPWETAGEESDCNSNLEAEWVDLRPCRSFPSPDLFVKLRRHFATAVYGASEWQPPSEMSNGALLVAVARELEGQVSMHAEDKDGEESVEASRWREEVGEKEHRYRDGNSHTPCILSRRETATPSATSWVEVGAGKRAEKDQQDEGGSDMRAASGSMACGSVALGLEELRRRDRGRRDSKRRVKSETLQASPVMAPLKGPSKSKTPGDKHISREDNLNAVLQYLVANTMHGDPLKRWSMKQVLGFDALKRHKAQSLTDAQEVLKVLQNYMLRPGTALTSKELGNLDMLWEHAVLQSEKILPGAVANLLACTQSVRMGQLARRRCGHGLSIGAAGSGEVNIDAFERFSP